MGIVERVKAWFWINRVCSKYKIKYSPFTKLGRAYYNYNKVFDFSSRKWKRVEHTVVVNPFNRHLKEDFLHELGHYLFRKNGLIDNREARYNYLWQDGKSLSSGRGEYRHTLYDEAVASKFARRAFKGASLSYLNTCFNSYSRAGYSFLAKHGWDGDKRAAYTDCVANMARKIQGVPLNNIRRSK